MRNDLHDDEFFDDFAQTARRWVILQAVLGFLFFISAVSFVGAIIYFFLAAAGVVPPLDLIPVVPYV